MRAPISDEDDADDPSHPSTEDYRDSTCMQLRRPDDLYHHPQPVSPEAVPDAAHGGYEVVAELGRNRLMWTSTVRWPAWAGQLRNSVTVMRTSGCACARAYVG
jgi:hypothetical protein